MIDMFGLALSHGLMMLAAWRLLSRPDLDSEEPDGAAGGWSSLQSAKPRDEAGA